MKTTNKKSYIGIKLEMTNAATNKSNINSRLDERCFNRAHTWIFWFAWAFIHMCGWGGTVKNSLLQRHFVRFSSIVQWLHDALGNRKFVCCAFWPAQMSFKPRGGFVYVFSRYRKTTPCHCGAWARIMSFVFIKRLASCGKEGGCGRGVWFN